MKKIFAFAIPAIAALVACGGTEVDANKDAAADAKQQQQGDGASQGVPTNHRATATACPTARGTDDGLYGDGGVPGSCTRDSDCTTGKNGRCIPAGGGAFTLQCSYDACSSDTDCANTVCVCRSSDTDTAPNECAQSTGNCRVDADCGANGYCSPSESKDIYCFSPDELYVCHTQADECTNDTDCGDNGSCNYDPAASHWKCGSLCAPPPP